MKFEAHLVNLTPHDITIQMADLNESFTIAPSGVVARCKTEYNTVAQVVAGGDVFNIRERYFNEPQDLPDPKSGTLYIVSRIVAEACGGVRDDLLMVDGTIRDENGRIIGCEAFARWPTMNVGICDDGIACGQNDSTKLNYWGRCSSCQEERDYEDDKYPKVE